jgi:polysaccharide pyruvyl transferase WcaK-like protein
MKKITILNPAISSSNLGDQIIETSVKNELYNIFNNAFFREVVTQDVIGKTSYKIIKDSDYNFLGGTNILSANMLRYRQWKIGIFDIFFVKNIILMGVGWWQYQNKVHPFTKFILKNALSKHHIHSVRDEYTKSMLESIGFKNVINTGCPTMWKLDENHCEKIPSNKSDNVVFTLTDYNQDLINDKKLIDILLNNYKKVYFWPQGVKDIDYINQLDCIDKINLLSPNILAFDKLLNDSSLPLDYIGTRLHAGIRALQKLRRSIIIGIDNRAIEKSKDFNLTVVKRKELNKVEDLILSNWNTKICLKENNINAWKKQFK